MEVWLILGRKRLGAGGPSVALDRQVFDFLLLSMMVRCRSK